MIRADLHVHSRCSGKPANWLAKQFSIPESFTEPLHIYDTAMKRGMTHVTITDHNTIEGCLEIAHLGNTFISCELTARFPEDGCRVHVLTHNITENQFRDLVLVRKDLYALVEYCEAHGIAHTIAHPLYSVNNMLTEEHFQKLLLLFDSFELNGFRSPDVNVRLRGILSSLTGEKLEMLADKHRIERPRLDPTRKHMISGSDDHSGMFVARSYTTNSGDTPDAFFRDVESNIPNPCPSDPQHLAYAIYSILYQHIEQKVDIDKYVNRDDGLKNISLLLTLNKPPNGSTFSSIVKWFAGHRTANKNDAEYLFRKTMKQASELTRDLTPENVPYRWFTTISTAVDESVNDLLEYTVTQVKSGNVFNIFRSFGSISSLYFLSIPYYVAYKSFQETRLFADSVDVTVAPRRKAKAVHLTDTYYEVNGVAKSLQQMTQCSQRLGLDYTFITCADTPSLLGEKVFKPIKAYDLPEYPEMKLACPPILEVIDYCYKEDFTHVHAATPGPVGLTGLLVAKLLNRPFFTTYHTALPQYAAHITGDQSMESLVWTYMRWFYNQADRVFAPSQAFRDELIANGIHPSRVVLMPRGVDTVRFHPRDWNTPQSGYNLVYVGRVSREKNLDVLADAFIKLGRDDVKLTIVGDGPYRTQLMSELAGYNVEFPGYLEGNELVESYRSADLFVFPSTTDTFGNVILEAHACAVPTLITDIGGPRENVIDGETGLVVPGKNVEALHAALKSLLDHRLLTTMGLQARQRVEKRSFDNAFLEYWTAYEGTPAGAELLEAAA